MTSSIFSHILYWMVYPIILVLWTLLVYNWKKEQKSDQTGLYIVALMCCVYLFLGILANIVIIPEDLVKAQAYTTYQQEEIIPVQDRYNNAQVPDGYYYLGVEICSIDSYTEDGTVHYIYDFGTVDYEEHDEIYQYECTEKLDIDVPYLLVMDSLGTSDIKDDQITVVWKNVRSY